VDRGLSMRLLDIQNNRFIYERGPIIFLNPGAASLIQSGNILQTNAAANNEGRNSVSSFGFAVADNVPIFDLLGPASDAGSTGFTRWEFVGDRFLP
jgi:hypothetical protein